MSENRDYRMAIIRTVETELIDNFSPEQVNLILK